MTDTSWTINDHGVTLAGRDYQPGQPLGEHELLVELNGVKGCYDVFDLLKAIIHEAYLVDQKQTAQILGEAVLGGGDG
jgi:hypothetical protein